MSEPARDPECLADLISHLWRQGRRALAGRHSNGTGSRGSSQGSPTALPIDLLQLWDAQRGPSPTQPHDSPGQP